MIRYGIHTTAVVDILGSATLPKTLIMEPLSVIYIGSQGSLNLGEMNTLYPHASIRIDQGSMTTGKEVSFGPGCHIYEPRAGLTIGDHCMIGGGVLICGVNHGMETREHPMRHQHPKAEPILLENDVWIGMGATILPGVCIGQGAVIGASSVVTENIPPFAVATGVPCKVNYFRKTS